MERKKLNLGLYLFSDLTQRLYNRVDVCVVYVIINSRDFDFFVACLYVYIPIVLLGQYGGKSARNWAICSF